MTMSAIRYAIHGLIDVFVDKRVDRVLLDAIDFQIGFFRTGSSNAPAPHQITVKPYADFALEAFPTHEKFHLMRGVPSFVLNDTEKAVAFEKTENGFTIYADWPSFILHFFLQFIFLEHDITFVHAAAVADKYGAVTLLPGAGGVGKTALLGEIVKRQNCRVLADDIALLSHKGECLSFPRSFVLKDYHKSVYPEVFQRLNIDTDNHCSTSTNKGKTTTALLKFFHENAPFIGLFKVIIRRLNLSSMIPRAFYYPQDTAPPPYVATVSVAEIFGKDSIADKGNIARVLFLKRYSGNEFRVQTISDDSVVRHMLAIIHHEWVDGMRQFFTMGALDMLDLLGYFRNVEAIMRSATSGKNCELLFIPAKASPHDLSEYYVSIS
jgi:hypothetical protein